MKKIFWIAAAAAGLSVTAACQKEPAAGVEGGDAKVTLTVEIPEVIQTKAMSQAEHADIVYYEIWNSDWSTQLYPADGVQASAVVDQRKATVDVTVIVDQTYNFIFWAQDKDHTAYDVTDLLNVKVDYSVIAADGNQDKYDAYYAVETIEVKGSIDQTVTLYRPFAQLNFGASKMNSLFGDITVAGSEIEVTGLATSFNTRNGVGEAVSAEPVIFKATGIATDELLATNNTTYTWIAMDYMLMMDEKSNVDVTASFDLGMKAPVQHHITNVPLHRNYRTNIIGDLFTADAHLDVVIDPAFQKPDEDITIGIAEEPAYDDQTKTYSIKTAGNVLWMAAQPKNFAAGKVISFDDDIDMMGQGIRPIMASSSSVAGTQVLGNGHKVSNFVVRETGRNAAGLFGDHKGNISKLHLENVTVDSEYKAGALVGSIYGNVTECSAKNVKITSIPYVTNGSFDGGNHVGALVGYASENGNATYIYSGNEVDGVVVTGYRDLGGLCGTVQYGVDVHHNQIKNVTIIIDRTNYYGDQDVNAGNVFGRGSSDSRFIEPHDNDVENVNIQTALPSFVDVDGVSTMTLNGNVALYNRQAFVNLDDAQNMTEDYTIDGNGATVTFVADDASDVSNQYAYTSFTSGDKNMVTVKDITFTGEFAFLAAGYWHGAPSSQKEKQFYTTFDNVNIIDAKVSTLQVSAQALFCDGVTVLNNCNIYGTQLSSFETNITPVYDLMTFNYTHTTLNGGKYGVVGSSSKSPQGTMVINGAEIETIENWYIARTTSTSHPDGEQRGLYINEGSKVNTINTYGSESQWSQLYIQSGAIVGVLTFDTKSLNNPKFTSEWIKIADGTVNKVIANGVEYTLSEFKLAYNL